MLIFKYCIHGIHEKQVLVRLVVDGLAYRLGQLPFNLKNEHSISIEKNRNKNMTIFHSIFQICEC